MPGGVTVKAREGLPMSIPIADTVPSQGHLIKKFYGWQPQAQLGDALLASHVGCDTRAP